MSNVAGGLLASITSGRVWGSFELPDCLIASLLGELGNDARAGLVRPSRWDVFKDFILNFRNPPAVTALADRAGLNLRVKHLYAEHYFMRRHGFYPGFE